MTPGIFTSEHSLRGAALSDSLGKAVCSISAKPARRRNVHSAQGKPRMRRLLVGSRIRPRAVALICYWPLVHSLVCSRKCPQRVRSKAGCSPHFRLLAGGCRQLRRHGLSPRAPLSIARSLTHSPTHPLTHPPTHPLTHPPTHSLTHSPTHPLTHSPTHPLTHPPTHSLTHSPTH